MLNLHNIMRYTLLRLSLVREVKHFNGTQYKRNMNKNFNLYVHNLKITCYIHFKYNLVDRNKRGL